MILNPEKNNFLENDILLVYFKNINNNNITNRGIFFEYRQC